MHNVQKILLSNKAVKIKSVHKFLPCHVTSHNYTDLVKKLAEINTIARIKLNTKFKIIASH